MNNSILFLSFFSLCFYLFLPSQCIAQTDSPITSKSAASIEWGDQGTALGLHFGRYTYGELGYYKSRVWAATAPISSTSMNYGIEFSKLEEWIIAPKIQARMSWYWFNGSLSLLYYTNWEQYALKVRPELGIGFYNVDINYGYNIGLAKNELNQINTHTLSMRYYLKWKRTYLQEYDVNGRPIK